MRTGKRVVARATAARVNPVPLTVTGALILGLAVLTLPVRAETVGRTEEIIGTWLAARGGRDRIVLATKVAGKGQIIRPGEPVTGATMRAAVEASLKR